MVRGVREANKVAEAERRTPCTWQCPQVCKSTSSDPASTENYRDINRDHKRRVIMIPGSSKLLLSGSGRSWNGWVLSFWRGAVSGELDQHSWKLSGIVFQQCYYVRKMLMTYMMTRLLSQYIVLPCTYIYVYIYVLLAMFFFNNQK